MITNKYIKIFINILKNIVAYIDMCYKLYCNFCAITCNV